VQVLCGIRYFAKGLFQVDDGHFFGISQPSVSRIVIKVANALQIMGWRRG
jgi:hypothetical protein